MPYDPAKPVNDAQIMAQVFRDQFNGLKDLIDGLSSQNSSLQAQITQLKTGLCLVWDAATSTLNWIWLGADPADSWSLQTSPNGIDQWGDYDAAAAGARSYSDTGLAGLYCRVFGKDGSGNPCTPMSNVVQAV